MQFKTQKGFKKYTRAQKSCLEFSRIIYMYLHCYVHNTPLKFSVYRKTVLNIEFHRKEKGQPYFVDQI